MRRWPRILGFVAHAAERDADELAPGRPRDRLAEGGLADPRRADETHDRPLQLLRALLHGKILDDPLLHLVERVVIVVEDLLGAAQILLDARLRAPRDGQHPVEIIAHDGRFRRHRRHVLQLLQLRLGLVACLLRQLGLGDALLEFRDLAFAVLAVAQLLLNGLHLLIQVIFALGALHLRLHAGLDLLLDLQDRNLALHQAVDLLQPLGDLEGLQKLLLLGHLDAEMAGHEIGELRRIAGLADSRQRLLGDVLLHLGVALELLAHGAQERVDGVLLADRLGEILDLGLEEPLVLDIIRDPDPRPPLDENLHGAVGQLEKLENVGQHPRAVNPLRGGIVHRRIDLAGEQNLLVLRHHLLEGAHGFLAADEQGHDHVWKDHDVAQWQDWIGMLGHVIVLVGKGSASRERQRAGPSDYAPGNGVHGRSVQARDQQPLLSPTAAAGATWRSGRPAPLSRSGVAGAGEGTRTPTPCGAWT